MRYLIQDYDVEVSVGRSSREIPYPYVLDGTDDLRLDGAQAADLAMWFPSTELAHIGDEIADGAWQQMPDAARPLSLFDGPRVDFSLARLRHYTGTPAQHTQRYLLFTNYVRYVDEFVRWAVEELRAEDSPYEGLSAAGRRLCHQGHARCGRPGRRGRLAQAPDARLPSDRARTAKASPWSISASARPTPRRSATISR